MLRDQIFYRSFIFAFETVFEKYVLLPKNIKLIFLVLEDGFDPFILKTHRKCLYTSIFGVKNKKNLYDLL
jgi:hypothetical protein